MLIDPRVTAQAKLIVQYCTNVHEGDVVQISGSELAKPLILEIYRQVIRRKAKEIITHINFEELQEILYDEASETQLSKFPNLAYHAMKNTDVWIGIISPKNTRHLSHTHPKKMSVHHQTIQPILNHRVEKTRWLLTAFPTEALAQEADMSIQKFSDFLFSTMVDVDWKKMAFEQNHLAAEIEKGSVVRIVGEDTDLELSIRGRKVVADNGESNMPGGEVFTSVVEDSTNGYIHFTYPAIYGGREVDGVKLWFEHGRVVKAKAKKGEAFLHHMLDVDDGARRLGELGIGNNFRIDHFVKNILFDEKIGGTVHLALGRAYKETNGINESSIHWDMIKDLRTGGMLFLDNKVLQKDGVWLI